MYILRVCLSLSSLQQVTTAKCYREEFMMAKPSFHDEGKVSPISNTTFTNLILPKLVAWRREVSYELQRGA